MQVAAFFLLIVCFGAAGYLLWRDRTPVYLFTICAGLLGAFAMPLLQGLYGLDIREGLGGLRAALSEPLPAGVLFASGWLHPLPALTVFFLYQTRWWFPGYLTGLLTFLVFLLYHLLMEALGLRSDAWFYRNTVLPLNMPGILLSATMAALVSLALLYVILNVYRYLWPSMLLALLPSKLLLSLLIYGLLGAPIWVPLLLAAEGWALLIGLLCSIGLILWAIHIITSGLRGVEPLHSR
jgi:hypothetical protein